MSPLVIDLTETPPKITVDPSDHRAAVLLDCIREADVAADAVVEEMRDTRIKIPAEMSNIGDRWSGPKDEDDDHEHFCSCGADCGRIAGAWYGFEVFPSGEMTCEQCDEIGF